MYRTCSVNLCCSCPSSLLCWVSGTTTFTVPIPSQFFPTIRYRPATSYTLLKIYQLLTFVLYRCSTCIVLRRTSNKATWSRTESRSHAVARESTTRPDPSCGENLVLTASTRSTSSSTKVMIHRRENNTPHVYHIVKSRVYSHVLGTRVIPCDFLAPIKTHNPVSDGLHHQVCCLSYCWTVSR